MITRSNELMPFVASLASMLAWGCGDASPSEGTSSSGSVFAAPIGSSENDDHSAATANMPTAAFVAHANARSSASPASSVVSIFDVPYQGAKGTQTVDLHYPTSFADPAEGAPSRPLYIHIHGGGWAFGDKKDDTALAVAIARKGFVVANINYTLAPPFAFGDVAATPYTIGPEDVDAFVRYVVAMTKGDNPFRVDPAKISIGGQSAGAHLALVQSARTTSSFQCVVDISGPTDLDEVLRMKDTVAADIVKAVFGHNPPAYLSPQQNVGVFNGKTLYVVHYANDTLMPITQASELVSAMTTSSAATSYWFPSDPDPLLGIPNHGYVSWEPVIPHAVSFIEANCK